MSPDQYPFPALPGGPINHQQLLYAFRHELRELCFCPGPPEHLKAHIEALSVFALMLRYDVIDFEMLMNQAKETLRKPAAREMAELSDRKESA